MSHKVLSMTGKDVTKYLAGEINRCYEELAGKGLIPITESQVRGQIQGYQFALQAMGYDYEVEIKIVEYKK